MNTTSHYTVPDNHPAFSGHFPNMPILPGVVLLDIALQVISDANGIALNHCSINTVKFIYPARPGDVLNISHQHTNSGTIHFDMSTATHKIASGSVVINPT